MAELTFAIPYANGSLAYLSRAIESVRAQTFADWTLAVVDDSRVSSAAARDLVAACADARIAYVRNDGPHGIGPGWNACVEASTAEYFVILHADDELEPAYAAEMLAFARRHPESALLYCNVSIIDESGAPVFSLRDRFKRVIQPRGAETVLAGASGIASLCVGNFIAAPAIVYRRRAIGGRRFSTHLRFMLDLDFTIDTLLAGETITGNPASLLRYRRHAAQQTVVLDRDLARIDEEAAYYEGLAVRLRSTAYARVAPFARLRLSTRLSGIVSALADVRRGRLQMATVKFVRSVRP